MKRTLLIVSGGVEALPGIRLAQRMGLHVVVSDGNPAAPGFAMADDAITASTYDANATIAEALRYHRQVRPINGVMCIAADVPFTVACVSNALGLPGITPDTAAMAMDKLAMKDRFFADSIALPWYRPVTSPAEFRDTVTERGIDLIIKPVDSRGARGVLRLHKGLDLNWAYEFARRESPTGRVMVEEFLAGPQVSTETIVIDGKAHTPGFSDRNYEFLERYSPHVIENGGDLPSHLPEKDQDAVKRLISEAAASLGVTSGVVKGDIVLVDGVPYVIELAARLSGGYFCSHEIPLNTGVDFVGLAIRVALGDQVDPQELVPQYQRPVSQRYLFPEPGEVVSVEGVDEVSCRPGIELCEIRVRPGDCIGTIHSHPARAGVVIATGDTPDQARKRACAAIRDVRIITRRAA